MASEPLLTMELRSNRLVCLGWVLICMIIGRPIRNFKPLKADGYPQPDISYFDAFGNSFSDPNGIQVRASRTIHLILIFTVHDSVRRALTEIKSPGFYDCEASNGISVITKGVKITRPNTLRKYINVIDDTYHMTHM